MHTKSKSSPGGTQPASGLAVLDREIFRLARAGGALRLRVGELLEGLCRAGGHHELGFSSPEAYVKERCSRGARWGQEAQALARRLTELPRVRRALLAGEISWSMAQVLARHASAENEDALLAEASRTTVRVMRERLRERAVNQASERAEGATRAPRRESSHPDEGAPKAPTRESSHPEEPAASNWWAGPIPKAPPAGGDDSARSVAQWSGAAATSRDQWTGPTAAGGGCGVEDEPGTRGAHRIADVASQTEEDEDPPRRLVTVSLSREEIWMWEATLKMVAHVAGHRMPFDDCVEAILAETWTTLLAGLEPGEEMLPDAVSKRRQEWRRQEADRRRKAEAACEAHLPVGDPVGGAAPEPVGGQPPQEVDRFGLGIPRCRLGGAAWRSKLRGKALRVQDALDGGIDRDTLIRILEERGLPTSLEEMCRIRMAAAKSAAPGEAKATGEPSPAGEARPSGAEGDLPHDDQPREARVVWSPEAIDREIRALVEQIQIRDVELGRLLLRLFNLNGWRRLGYATEAQYARERVGMSLAAVKAHRALARRLEMLPQVARAATTGQIGYESARLVARVASPPTAAAWVERAAKRTVKHLREEVEAMELLARCEGPEVQTWGPPDDDVLEAVFETERMIRRGGTIGEARFEIASGPDAGMAEYRSNDEGQMSAPASEENNEEARRTTEDGGQMSGSSSEEKNEEASWASEDRDQMSALAGNTTLRLYLHQDVADLWDSLRALWRRLRGRLGLPSFVRTLCWSTWQSWGPSLGPRGVASEDIYERDRWVCASPVCERTDNTPHHLTLRSQGGTDEKENLSGRLVPPRGHPHRTPASRPTRIEHPLANRPQRAASSQGPNPDPLRRRALIVPVSPHPNHNRTLRSCIDFRTNAITRDVSGNQPWEPLACHAWLLILPVWLPAATI